MSPNNPVLELVRAVREWIVPLFRTLLAAAVISAIGFAWKSNEMLTRILSFQELRTQIVDQNIGDIKEQIAAINKKIDINYTESAAEKEHGRIYQTLGDHESRIRGLEAVRPSRP